MENEIDELILKNMVGLLVEKLNPTFIYLFGSAATNTMNKDSDIDIAFLSKGSFDKYDLFILAQELSDIAKRDVDLINLADTSTVFKVQIIGKGKVIYSNDEYFRHEYEIRALKEYTMLNRERKEIINNVIKEGSVYG